MRGDHVRDFVADDLSATTYIKRNPTRREDRILNRMLYHNATRWRVFQQTQTRPVDRGVVRKINQLSQHRLRDGADHPGDDTA